MYKQVKRSINLDFSFTKKLPSVIESLELNEQIILSLFQTFKHFVSYCALGLQTL